MKKILGVILCGGESKRMGTDKGLKSIEDTTWAQYMADKLAFLECAVVFSINENQFKDYSKYISPEVLVTDSPTNIKGPLKGLLSVHSRFPGHDLLLIACDMLQLDEFTIRKVWQVYQQDNQYEFYVCQDQEYAQPFCGIYTAIGLENVSRFIQTTSLSDFSMQSLLNKGHTKRIAVDHMNVFRNFNFNWEKFQ